MAVDVFSVPVFLVVFRESLETAIIVSVLLAFLKQTFGQDEEAIVSDSVDNFEGSPEGNAQVPANTAIAPYTINAATVEVQQTENNDNTGNANTASTPNTVDTAAGNARTGGTNANTNNAASTSTSSDARPPTTPYRRLVRQVWIGTAAGLVLCLCVASVIIALFYTVGADHWSKSEEDFEGAFALAASLIISVVGAALLRVGRMQTKWRRKLEASLRPRPADQRAQETRGCLGRLRRRVRVPERYALLVLPLVTVLREGIEAIVFVAGVSFSAPARSVPLPVVVGLLAGVSVGYLLYKGGSSRHLFFSLKVFLVASTGLLYLVAAGLFSRAVWSFEIQKWNGVIGSDAAELGSGPGSYDIDKSVWHINCCNPDLNGGGGWGFFNAVFGWTNSATYGSVLAYNLYWLAVILAFASMRYREVRGAWPWRPSKRSRRKVSSPVQEGLQLPDIEPVSPLQASAMVPPKVVIEKVA